MNFIKPLAAALAIAVLASPAFAEDTAPAAAEETSASETVTATVNGLVCDFCAQSIRKVFGKQDAVSDVNVDLDNGLVILTMKPGQTMDDASIEKLIRKSGYSLVGLDRAGGA